MFSANNTTSMPNRREILKLILAGAAGMALDPERLLWTPRAMITVPAPFLPMYHHSPITIETTFRYISLAMGVPGQALLMGTNNPGDRPVAIAGLPTGEWFKLNVIHPPDENGHTWTSGHVKAGAK